MVYVIQADCTTRQEVKTRTLSAVGYSYSSLDALLTILIGLQTGSATRVIQLLQKPSRPIETFLLVVLNL